MGYILKQTKGLVVNLEARWESFYLHCNTEVLREESPELEGKVSLAATVRCDDCHGTGDVEAKGAQDCDSCGGTGTSRGHDATEVAMELTYDQIDPLIESLVRLRNYLSNRQEDIPGAGPSGLSYVVVYQELGRLLDLPEKDGVNQAQAFAVLQALYEQGRADGRRDRSTP